MNKATGKYAGYTDVKYVGGRLSRGKASNGLYALLNCDTGEALSDPIYEGVRVSTSNTHYISVVGNGGLVGLVDKTGKEVIEPMYQYLSLPQFGVIIFGQDNKFGLMSDKFEVLIPAIFIQLKQYGGILVAGDGKNEYLIKPNGERVSKKYKSIGTFLYSTSAQMSYAIVQDENGYGIINSRGEETVRCEYESLETALGYKALHIAKTKEGYYVLVSSSGGIAVNGKYIEAAEVLGGIEFKTEDNQKLYFKYASRLGR